MYIHYCILPCNDGNVNVSKEQHVLSAR